MTSAYYRDGETLLVLSLLLLVGAYVAVTFLWPARGTRPLFQPGPRPSRRSPRTPFRPGAGPEEETMYTPALRPDQIRALYQLGQRTGEPMTKLLREALDRYPTERKP